MNDDWTGAQHHDEQLNQQRLLAALKAAEAAGTPRDDVIDLAAGLGLAYEYQQETDLEP